MSANSPPHPAQAAVVMSLNVGQPASGYRHVATFAARRWHHEQVPPAVVFDLFETLVTEVVTEGQMPPTGHPSSADLLGIERGAFKAAWSQRKIRRMTSVLPYEAALVEICGQFGVRPGSREVRELVEARRVSKAMPFSRVAEPVLAMLEDLRSRGCALGLVSNCSVEDVEGFPNSPLASCFDQIIWSYQVGLQKPDPRIYQVACQRLKALPGETLFVGDGSFDELEGAAAAALRPVWASWFVAGWPESLRVLRRAYVEHLGVPEAHSPRMITKLAFAGCGDGGSAG